MSFLLNIQKKGPTMDPDPTQQFSSEVLLFQRFYLNFAMRRISDIDKIHPLSALMELPRSCCLHLLNDNFLMNKPIVFTPESDNPFMLKNPHLKFMNHVTSPISGMIPYPEKFVLPPKGLIPTLMNYRRRNIRFIKPWEDMFKLPGNVNSQMIISYHSLYRARIFGMLKGVRRFNFVFTSVLNQINKMAGLSKITAHIIPIPVGNTAYTKTQFILSYKKYDKASIKYPEDPWYLFCMNLVGHMHTGTPSLFSRIPLNVQKNIYFLLYNNRDFVLVNLASIVEYNKGSKDVIMIRFLKMLESLTVGGQSVSYTDFGAVEPAIDISSDVDVDGVSETDINRVEIPALTEEKDVVKVKQKVKPAEKLKGKVTEDEVVERPKADEQVEQPQRVKFTSTLPREHESVVNRFKRLFTDTRVSEIFGHEKTTTEKFLTTMNQALMQKIKEEEKPAGLFPVPKSAPSLKTAMPISKKNASVTIVPDEEEPEDEDELMGELQEAEKLPDIVDHVDTTITKVQPKIVLNGSLVTNSPAYTKSVKEEDKRKFDQSTTDDIDAKAMETIDQHTELTDAQYKHAIKVANAYKDVVLFNDESGKKVTIASLLNSSPDDTVSSSSLDFLKGQIPDESMLKSSVANFDKEYMDKFFLRDLVMELTSFNKVGMFLKDLKIEDVSDSMNNTLEIKAKYEDINHKPHTIRFTIPKVDDRGYCYINGGLKVMKKQRITVPICKVSPTRVTLSSDYGKYLVERVTAVAHSFINYVDKIISAADGQIKVTFGTAALQPFIYPYEFTAIGKKYTSFVVSEDADARSKWYFFFNDSSKLTEYFLAQGFTQKQIKEAVGTANELKGYLVGMHDPKDPSYVYMKLDGSTVVHTSEGVTSPEGLSFIDLLCELCAVSINNLSEWTELKLLSKSIPTIFALCYRYGLSYMLNYTKCKYAIYNKRGKYPRHQSDVIIKFQDKVLVIPRAPLCFSLLFAGLNSYDLTHYDLEEMDSKDVYYELLQSKRMSVHNLKSIDNFFDMFVDPITRDILFRMGEPTEAKDLLIRATALLTTEDCPPVSVCSNHRFRSYERINTAIYKTLSALYSTFRYKSIGSSSTFSIKDFEIAKMVVSDQLMENIEQINPINDIKYREEYGHGGTGGRQSVDTFMIDDRQWPEDGIGIIGESSVDNGKTGYVGNMSNNPSIDNIRGLTISKPIKDLEPSEILTCAALFGPGVIQDDSKRFSFLNIHLSHYVATQENSLPRVRTGYERVVAHRCKRPFAYTAEFDGVIESVDEDSHMVVVSYPKQHKKAAIEYGEVYTSNGGGGFYCTQRIVLNGFKKGDKVKRGDVIAYNDQFFKADPTSKQVDAVFGLLANVVMIDAATTVEDSDIISEDLAKKLSFNPVHPRDIVITKKTNVHKYAAVGTPVSNADPLMIYDQAELTDDMFGKLDDETAVLLGDVNRQTPKAKFSGKIVKIDAFYLGTTEGMSDSVRNLVNSINREKSKKHNLAKGTESEDQFYPNTNIQQSTRIGTVVLDDETVIIRFYVQQGMIAASGDKLELGTSLKSVCSTVDPHGWDTEDGTIHCDMLFSQLGQHKRLVNSPLLQGISNRCLEKVERDVLSMYFD